MIDRKQIYRRYSYPILFGIFAIWVLFTAWPWASLLYIGVAVLFLVKKWGPK